MTDEEWRASLAAYSTTAASTASRESVTCIVAAAECAQAKRSHFINHQTADLILSTNNKKQVTIMEPAREDGDLPSSRRQCRQQIPSISANSSSIYELKKNTDSGNEEGDDQFIPSPPQTTTTLLHAVADKLQMISPTNSNISPVHSIDRQSDNDSGCPLEEYAWVPAGLRPDLVHRYFSAFPDHQIPYVNSAGEKLRVRVLLHQLPPHDNDLRYCHHLLDEQQRGEMRRFIAQRKQLALGRATVKLIPRSLATRAPCKQCHGQFKPGALAVFAARDGPYSCWHPQCFCCTQCNELLVDLIYFHNGDQKVYCGRHHAELWKPRCAACDEIIFSDDCTEAEGNTWHPQHFCCSQCDVALGGRRYICRECRPYCVGCYEMLFSRTCAACKQTISVEQLQVSHNNIHWHAHEQCFRCQQCATSLINKHFLPRNGNVFCSTKCLDAFAVGPLVAPISVEDKNEVVTEEQQIPVGIRQLEAIQEEDDEILDNNQQQSARRSATPNVDVPKEEGKSETEQQRPLVVSTSRTVPGSASVRRSASQRYVESFQLSSTLTEPEDLNDPPPENEQPSLETVLRENAKFNNQSEPKSESDRLADDLASIYVNIFPDGLNTKIVKASTKSQSSKSSCGSCSGSCSNSSKESTPSQTESKSGNSGRNSSCSSLQRRVRANEPRKRHSSGDCTHSCSVHSPCRRRPTDDSNDTHPQCSRLRRPQRPVAISLSNDENIVVVAAKNENVLSQLTNSLSSYSNFDPQQQLQTPLHRTPPPPIPLRHPQTILTPAADRRAALLASNNDSAVSPYSIGNATPNPLSKFSHHHPAAPYFTPSALKPRACCQQSSSDVGIEPYQNRRQLQFNSSSSSAVSAHRYQSSQQPPVKSNQFMYGSVGGGGLGSTVRINTLTSANNNSRLACTQSSSAPWTSSCGQSLGVIADDGIYSVGCLGHMSAASRRKRRSKNCSLKNGAILNGNSALTRLANNKSSSSSSNNSSSYKTDGRCVIS